MSDRITIINNDNGTVDVNLNGENLENVPTTNLDPSIHAVQWFGDRGEVEYNDRNEDITEFSEFDIIMTDRQTEIDRLTQEAQDNEPSEEEKDRSQRDSLLELTDWIVVKYLDIGDPVPQVWSDYRQALRDITEQSGFPGNVDWPEEPTTTP
jgi:hypothetical protein